MVSINKLSKVGLEEIPLSYLNYTGSKALSQGEWVLAPLHFFVTIEFDDLFQK